MDLSNIGTLVTGTEVLFKGSYSPLSNLYNCSLEDSGLVFNSSEQLYQHRRALDANNTEVAARILEAKDPYDAMLIGKQIKTNDQWAETSGVEIMHRSLTIKASQVPEFRNLLLLHAAKTFREASSNRVWGIGVDLYSPDIVTPAKWPGKNLMGKVCKRVAESCISNNTNKVST